MELELPGLPGIAILGNQLTWGVALGVGVAAVEGGNERGRRSCGGSCGYMVQGWQIKGSGGYRNTFRKAESIDWKMLLAYWVIEPWKLKLENVTCRQVIRIRRTRIGLILSKYMSHI